MSRERNIETVRKFIYLFEQKNFFELSELYTENGKLIYPYHSGLFPPDGVGKKNIYEGWSNLAENFDEVKFPIEEIVPFENPNKVAVKFSGKLKFRNKPSYYENDYLFIFYFDEEGKITESYEYFNPINAAKAFGLMDKLCK
ncbi:MAG: nuclear transport factor 2 family protein [Candidatus Heimdallarchaeota archaeon]|nr:nuclear transport factor 2 family protein [Candidatus Heimdallarchaeota archaeon]MCK4878018.1 nuclear transport factor 2 family protein [Candidatus Heimdallarchaeota archaeon]